MYDVADVSHIKPKISLVRQLSTDANDSLVALAARDAANGDDGDRGYLTSFCAPEQPALLNVPEELGCEDVAEARHGAALDKETAAADGGHHAVKKRKGHSGGRRPIEHLRDRYLTFV